MRNTDLNVLQFTDMHIYARENGLFCGVDTRMSFNAVKNRALVQSRDYDLILVTGDLAMEPEAPAYAWLVEQFEVFDAPVYCLPGNHDAAKIMERSLSAAGWNYCPSHTVGGWHIVLLDSTVLGEAYGSLGDAELDRLDDALARHRILPTLVGLHHHPVAIESRWMDRMRLHHAARFWAVIDRYPQVRCILWGHVHQNFDTYRNGVRLLATPSTCTQFAARSANFAIDPLPPGFRRLQLSSDGTMTTDIIRV